jgi:hypothetical protein
MRSVRPSLRTVMAEALIASSPTPLLIVPSPSARAADLQAPSRPRERSVAPAEDSVEDPASKHATRGDHRAVSKRPAAAG